MAEDRGSTVYAAYVKELLAGQDARKSSIEARGMAVITSSGTLVSLLFGLVAVLTGVEKYDLPGGAEPWLYVALVAFVVAAIGGIGVNAPLLYVGVKADKFRAGVKARLGDDAKEAERMVIATNAKVLEQATKLNTIKGYVLLAAVIFEVIAVASLALAIRAILGA